jgi:predicted GNAT superfamily acetyltransferase
MNQRATAPVSLREAVQADQAAILTINNAAVPAMNELDLPRLDWLMRHAAYARVAVDADGIAAFLIGLPPGIGYDSANYRWFSERYRDFLYIDRIAVASRARRLGVGSALYDDIAEFARGRWSCLLAEVNRNPPNPVSIVFHERHGFVTVGALEHTSEGAHSKAVIMLRRTID